MKFSSLTATEQSAIISAIGNACGEKAQQFDASITQRDIDRCIHNAGVYARLGRRWLSVLQVSYSSARNIAVAITSEMHPDLARSCQMEIEAAGFESRQEVA